MQWDVILFSSGTLRTKKGIKRRGETEGTKGSRTEGQRAYPKKVIRALNSQKAPSNHTDGRLNVLAIQTEKGG